LTSAILLVAFAGGAWGSVKSGLEGLPGSDCTFCGNCSNHNAVRPPPQLKHFLCSPTSHRNPSLLQCVPSNCGGCPSLLAASQASNALIMKVNWTRHDYAWGFQGQVLRMYTVRFRSSGSTPPRLLTRMPAIMKLHLCFTRVPTPSARWACHPRTPTAPASPHG
jgi:hypothetical protein